MTEPANAAPAPPRSGLARMLTFIRFSHTIFALPFALGAAFVAARGWPPLRLLGLVIVEMVLARTAAMIFNRLADWEIDKRNPRTTGRHKLVSRGAAITLLVFSSIAFVAAAAWINRLCFMLSPVALVILFFYSLTKRFTSFSHFFLGLALGISPIGAWLAIRGRFDLPPFVLCAAVLLWVAGFDLIYATQDEDFDRQAGLRSMVVTLGASGTLALAQWLHAAMLVLLVCFGAVAHLGRFYDAGLVLIFPALIYEHLTARKRDLGAINRAFFYSNAFVGFVFVLSTLTGVLLDR
ncbi:MAG TPA: UbiA-like polyprenyltransferase [Chthoniobacteraceae bacterium]|jgi:4-hydroxybenzoate polyprenyltransferase|nr:UbiA-like polyprenyltransferase [Chthoniobacteraceae bacterium]